MLGNVCALVGFLVGMIPRQDRSGGRLAKWIEPAAQIFLVSTGIALLAKGILGRSSLQVIYGLIALLAPVVYAAAKRKRYVAAVACVFAGGAFLILAILTHNHVWLIASALLVLAATGFYLFSGQTSVASRT